MNTQAQIVRDYRKRAQLTQRQLATAWGMNPNEISDVECGRRTLGLKRLSILALQNYVSSQLADKLWLARRKPVNWKGLCENSDRTSR